MSYDDDCLGANDGVIQNLEQHVTEIEVERKCENVTREKNKERNILRMKRKMQIKEETFNTSLVNSRKNLGG